MTSWTKKNATTKKWPSCAQAPPPSMSWAVTTHISKRNRKLRIWRWFREPGMSLKCSQPPLWRKRRTKRLPRVNTQLKTRALTTKTWKGLLKYASSINLKQITRELYRLILTSWKRLWPTSSISQRCRSCLKAMKTEVKAVITPMCKTLSFGNRSKTVLKSTNATAKSTTSKCLMSKSGTSSCFKIRATWRRWRKA